MRRFSLILLCLGLFAAWAAPAPAEELTMASAINKAGRQRMLTQRILKAYCQVGLGILPRAAHPQLTVAVERFDEQLAELKAFAPSARIREALARVDELWLPFKAIATAPVSREGAEELLFWNDDLLFASHKVVQLLQDASGTAFARLVNISGRQRMLSQRLAKFYMLRVWGFDTLTISDEVETARIEFAAALAELRGAPENSEAVSRELEAVALQWEWFQNALALEGAESYRLVVADASESVLNSMDLITAMYEELARQ